MGAKVFKCQSQSQSQSQKPVARVPKLPLQLAAARAPLPTANTRAGVAIGRCTGTGPLKTSRTPTKVLGRPTKYDTAGGERRDMVLIVCPCCGGKVWAVESLADPRFYAWWCERTQKFGWASKRRALAYPGVAVALAEEYEKPCVQ